MSSPPRMPEFQRDLERLAASAAPMHAAPLDRGWDLVGESLWDSALAPDFKRAALEIYRSIRCSGARSVRDWLGNNCHKAKDSPLWVDLWTTATNADFILTSAAQRGGEGAVRDELSRSDVLEIGLRRLASQIYFDRTRDRAGSQAMLRVVPPGAGSDIAPHWLISDVTAYSKSEHQREERVHTTERRRNGGKDNSSNDSRSGAKKGAKGGGKKPS